MQGAEERASLLSSETAWEGAHQLLWFIVLTFDVLEAGRGGDGGGGHVPRAARCPAHSQLRVSANLRVDGAPCV